MVRLSALIMRISQLSLARFLVVSVAGLCVDLGTAWLLRATLAINLTLAAFIGFCAGAVFNYLLHERWTFATRAQSAKRGAIYLLALMATVATRVATVSLIDETRLPDLAVLTVAAALSFIVNYLLSRFLVFRPGRSSETISP